MDELTAKRIDSVGTDKVPPFERWLLAQRHNPDPELAAAATYIAGEFALGPWYRHDRVVRQLQAESSPYHRGALRLYDRWMEKYPNARPEDAVTTGALPDRTLPVEVDVDEVMPLCDTKDCTRPSFPSGKCWFHGGADAYLSDEERNRIAAHVADRITHGNERAMSVLLEILNNGKSEKVRADIAIKMLEFGGHAAVQTLRIVNDEDANSPARIVMERLNQLAAGHGDPLAIDNPDIVQLSLVPDVEILDAELVDPN